VEHQVIDYYMLWFTFQIQSQRALYVPMWITTSFSNSDYGVTDAHCRLLRACLGQDQNAELPSALPLAMCLRRSGHFFVVVLDYHRQRAFVFGRKGWKGDDGETEYTEEQVALHEDTYHVAEKWEDVGGPRLWEAGAKLLGRPYKTNEGNGIRCRGVRWPTVSRCLAGELMEINQLIYFLQNGSDCAPEAVSILKGLIERGLDLTVLGYPVRPPKQCAHFVRQQMVDTISASVWSSYKYWDRHHRSVAAREAWEGAIDVCMDDLAGLIGGPRSDPGVQQMLDRLTKAAQHCPRCRSNRRALQGGALGPHEDSDEVGEDPESEEQDSDAVASTWKSSLRALKAPRKIARRARHVEAVDIPMRPMDVFLRYNPRFDDYGGDRPTLEDHMGVSIAVTNFPRNPYGERFEESLWSHWVDYGFRIYPDFANNWLWEEPCLPLEHFLPVAETFGDDVVREAVLAADAPLGRGPRDDRGPPEFVDVVVMGAQAMLEGAGDAGSDESLELFVCGRVDGRYVSLDLEQDAQAPSSVTVTADIDSVIWVTSKLHFLSHISIHMLPYTRDKPPIDHHNHTYVNVLPPWSDVQRANNEQTRPKRFRVSHIPHTHFAQIGDGIFISVFFPRMIHRQRDSPFMATKVPWLVQECWLTHVVQPSLMELCPVGMREYVEFTFADWRRKGANNSGAGTKTLPLAPDLLDELQERMKERIAEDRDRNGLSMFGSFFFVLDIKGVKLITKDCLESNADPLAALERAFPALDIDYMAQPRNGECHVDLGVSFSTREPDPLVGLWRLDRVEASYAKAGMNKPTWHALATMANYGGMQAEWPCDRAAAVQLRYRQTYPLVYEVVRRPGRDVTVCEDKDAFAANRTFKKSTEEHLDMYARAAARSYGVRDELRGSIPAIRTMLRELGPKVREIMNEYIPLHAPTAARRLRPTWPRVPSCG
jgi:hypothetical protein